MSKEVVLKEAEYLELQIQAKYWKSRFQARVFRQEELKTALRQFKKENRDLKRRLKELELMYEKQEASNQVLRKIVFGSRSEKAEKDPENSGKVCSEVKKPSPGRKRGKQKGSQGYPRRSRKELREEEREINLEKGAENCQVCGKPYAVSNKTEDSEEIERKAEFIRVKYKRKRYIKECHCEGTPRFKVAPKPNKLTERGLLSVSVISWLIMLHYDLQYPLNRIIRMLKMEGLELGQGMLTGVMKRLRPLFRPLYQEILKESQKSSHWHMDETSWRMFCDKKGKRWWLWVVSTAHSVVFILDPSRSSQIPKTFFGDEAEGTLNVDRYSAYKSLGKKILLSFCWAHVRRDFIRAKEGYVVLTRWGERWLKRISRLYELNRIRLSAEPQSRSFQKADKALRAYVHNLERICRRELEQKQLHPQQKKVLKSLMRHWNGLTVFADRPWVPMDNNEAERCLRNAVVGRKIYYGSGALWSGELTSCLFSLLETLKKNQVNPLNYLNAYLKACAQAGGKAPDDLAPFLPWNWRKEQKQAA